MNPIMIEFPDELYTERLYIRAPRFGDGKVVYEALKHSNEALKPWMPFAQKVPIMEKVEEEVRQAHVRFLTREDLRLHIFHRESGQFVGSTGLHRINWNVRRFEIGYWVDQRHERQGFITEAVQGITTFAFQVLKANRIEIRCDELNRKSRAVPERLGFTLEGILLKDDVAVNQKNELRNTCIYAKVSKDTE
ncbi:GNAT family N-acetyltransferase [Geomicrobium sp. JCM 19055]|uniref:GNAT family N-acetyltransferase n=1 Tax=Geomicrobium sp. JCM 19055 TaxID=1460649 RepID=UPI00045ED725|nr:GNAT family N-acetyltransferase [Geomicrobium sp. JCM 19055]GAJ98370.1 acetyltransferase, GNAT family [Geomicrobium sp. JCM 19055]